MKRKAHFVVKTTVDRQTDGTYTVKLESGGFEGMSSGHQLSYAFSNAFEELTAQLLSSVGDQE